MTEMEWGERGNCDYRPMVPGLYAEPLLLYAPYDSPKLNRIYRGANNIHRAMSLQEQCIPIGPVCTGEWTLAASRGHR